MYGPLLVRRTIRALTAALSVVAFGAAPVALAKAEIRNYGTATNTSASTVSVHPYSGGTVKLYDVAADWAPGTFTNTATNGAGDLVLSTVGPGFATAGTWESPTIDSGGTGAAAIYGLFNAAITLPAGAANVALGKAASLSSTGFSGIASFGNDGNTSGVYGYAAGSVFHTGTNAEQGWWQVDLGANYPISSVNLWNRTDCCGPRDSNLWVMVSALPFPATLAAALASGAVTKVQVPGMVGTPSTATFPTVPSGRYVRVQQPINEWLHLAEVQVMTSATGAATFQVASADSASGPWNYVGPDGTAATTFSGANVALPYALDRHQFFRVRASLSGNGLATPSVQTLRFNYALPAATRVAGGTFPIAAPTGSPSWLARIVSTDPVVATKPARLLLGVGSIWNTSTSQFSLDSPATTCCSASYITVTAGAPTVTGAAASSTFAVGATDAALSVIATRSDAIGSTAMITPSVALSGGTRLEIPLAVTLP